MFVGSSIIIPNLSSRHFFVIIDWAAPVSTIASTFVSLISTIVFAQSVVRGGFSSCWFVPSTPVEGTFTLLNF